MSLTQEELAERVGVHVGYVSQIERGVRTPSLRILARLAQALQVSQPAILEMALSDKEPFHSHPSLIQDEQSLLVGEICSLVGRRSVKEVRLTIAILRNVYALIDRRHP